MDIVEACTTIRYTDAALNSGHRVPFSEVELSEAMGVIKRFIELARASGKLIHQLDIADYLLCTRQGIRWIMPW